MTIHNPQSSIHGRSDLKDEAIIFYFASLLNVARACGQKLSMPARVAPLDISKGFPRSPPCPYFFEQNLWMIESLSQDVMRLAILWESNQVFQWPIDSCFTMSQIDGVTRARTAKRLTVRANLATVESNSRF